MKQHTKPPPADVASGVAADGALDVPVRAAADEDAVLDSLRDFRAEELRREKAMVLLAVQWARLKPGEALDPGDTFGRLSQSGMEEMWEALAAHGCPHVDDLAVPAFAAAAGMTEFQAGNLIRESLLLVFLLPRVWGRAAAGQLEVWRARKLASECWGLSPEALAYIDRNMSLATARHTEGGRAGIIEEAKIRYLPEVVEREEELAKERRCVEFNWEEDPRTGTVHFGGALELTDARDLEAAVAAGAEAIKNLGSEAPLSVRRSWALGDLARAAQCAPAEPQATPLIPFHPDCACQQERPRWNGTGVPASEVKVYLHLTPEALTEDGQLAPIRVEGKGIPPGTVITAETIREWFTRPGSQPGHRVRIRPVIDLADHQHVDAYEVPERIKEQVGLRDGGCVFPWCGKKLWRTDCDHIVPWRADGSGGPTCSCNLAPLCRRHHRAKTHADNHKGSAYTWWRYDALGEGRYLWRGPNGTRLLRTNTGVYDITEANTSNAARLPGTIGAPMGLPEAIGAAPLPRIARAQQVVDRITRTLDDVSDLHEKFPADPTEKPYFQPRTRLLTSEELNAALGITPSTPPPF